MIITKINFKIVNPLTDTFDDFIDDILSSDFHLLKGELDILLMQNLFHSINLEIINDKEFSDNDSLAA